MENCVCVTNRPKKAIHTHTRMKATRDMTIVDCHDCMCDVLTNQWSPIPFAALLQCFVRYARPRVDTMAVILLNASPPTLNPLLVLAHQCLLLSIDLTSSVPFYGVILRNLAAAYTSSLPEMCTRVFTSLLLSFVIYRCLTTVAWNRASSST